MSDRAEQVDASTPESLPEYSDNEAWRSFCLGSSGKSKDGEDDVLASASSSPPHLPSLSFMLGLDQVQQDLLLNATHDAT